MQSAPSQTTRRSDLAAETFPSATRTLPDKGCVTRAETILPSGKRAVTVSAPLLASFDPEAANRTAAAVEDVLRSFLPRPTDILCVGLGNAEMTCDALGPEVIKRLVPTRHLAGRLAAFAPGVTGTTGIETADTVKGLVDRIRPDALLLVDALASRALERVGTTIQITDRGIEPGSGIGNTGAAIDETTTGVPCIVIGAPTVVHASTLTLDLLERAYETAPELAPAEADRDELTRRILSDRLGGMIVTPRSVDLTVQVLARILSHAINAVCAVPD